VTTTWTAPGISCQHCVDAITAEVGKVAGVTDIAIDLDDKTVAVTGGDNDAVVAAILEAGYDVN